MVMTHGQKGEEFSGLTVKREPQTGGLKAEMISCTRLPCSPCPRNLGQCQISLGFLNECSVSLISLLHCLIQFESIWAQFSEMVSLRDVMSTVAVL